MGYPVRGLMTECAPTCPTATPVKALAWLWSVSSIKLFTDPNAHDL